MKRKVIYSLFILAVIVVVCFACYQIMESNDLERKAHHTIDKAIMAGKKYDHERNDANRAEFIETLKGLVVIYAEIRDRENGDQAYHAKLLCDLLSSSYDILEVDREQARQLGDLLDGLHMLKQDPFDESGSANDYILRFVKAN